MIAGRLRHRIVIEHTLLTGGNFMGEEEPREVERFVTRADIKRDGGGRTVENSEVAYPYDITFIVWLYMRDRVSEYDHVVYGEKRYRIISLEPDEESKILYIKCQSRD